MNEKRVNELLNLISKMLKENSVDVNDMVHLKMIEQRERGKKFTFSEHIRALIYSLLTNQTRWVRIVPNLPKIDELFFNYDRNRIMNTNWEFFYEGILALKCGNISTKKQMQNLHININTMQKIELDFGSIDNYIISDIPIEIAKSFANRGKYKLNFVGIPLALEYLRNVGINEIKPDVHIRRVLSNERLHLSESQNVSEYEAITIIKKISEITNRSVSEIDALLWLFCADGYCEICTSNPKCYICKLKDNYCNYNLV